LKSGAGVWIVAVWLVFTVTVNAKCDTDARKLVSAYSQLTACRDNRIYWRDGSSMLYDDGKKRSFDELLERADIQDMFHYDYPKGSHSYGRAPKRNFDPGRIRNEAFFKKLYGATAKEVRKNLKRIRWLPRSAPRPVYLRVTRVNGVDRALEAVSRELDRLPKRYLKYLYPVGGTFKWRRIAGTKRLSVHSFGAAVDINVKHSAYWRWSRGGYRYRNEIPLKIVEIFERHGFIWGGKWYHYDTMHFEYRPELLR
jgi:hypothetical protein